MLTTRLRNRLADRGEDEGFVLIYVLMIVAIITTLVGSVLVVSTNTVVPTVQTAYSQAADAAAQGGVQAFVATARSNCPNGATNTVSTCTSKLATSGSGTVYSAGGYTATYAWTMLPVGSQYFRVTSVGKVTKGGITATRTLRADLAGGSSTNCLDYSMCTQFETQSPDVMAQQFPSRSVYLDASTRAKADTVAGSTAGTVSWNAPTTNTSAAGTVNTCNDLYYGTNGREFNQVPGAGSSFVDWSATGTLSGSTVTNVQPCQVSLGASTKLLAPSNTANGAGGYYTRDALLLSNSTPGATGGPQLDQPVYTGYSAAADPNGTVGKNYRSLVLPGYNPQVGGDPSATSKYAPQYVQSGPAQIAASPSIPTGSCVYVGPTRVKLNSDGTATITSPQTRSAVAGSPAACYPASFSTGIFFFTTVPLTSIAGFSGVISVRNNGTATATSIDSSHSSTGWPLSGQKSTSTASSSNTVFYQSSPASGSADTSSVSAANSCSSTSTYTGTKASTSCQWSDASSSTAGSSWVADGVGWTKYSTGTTCGNDSTDRLTFECDYNRGSIGTSHDLYGQVRTNINIALSRNSISCGGSSFNPMTATTAQLKCELESNDGVGAADSTASTVNAAGAKPGDHQYVATLVPATAPATNPVVTSGTKTLGTAPSISTNGDTFFDSSNATGTASTETASTTASTFEIDRQIYGCYVPANATIVGTLQTILAALGLAAAPGSYDPTNKLCGQVCTLALLCSQGPGTYTWGDGGVSASSVGKSVPQFRVTINQNSYSGFTQGQSASVNFPSMKDVTQYAMARDSNDAPGDLYVQGTATTSLALVAANDVVVTGSLAPAAPTTSGLQVVAQDNVRVYHPVSCVDTTTADINATTAGFCPDDLTGLYKTIPASGSRPYQQYTNLRSDLAGESINAAVFALGNATSSTACPQWNNTGTCGGEVTTDNYNRGAGLGALSVTGTIVQVHHGAVGQEWEVPDLANQARPQSGYSLTATYQNLKTLTAGVNVVDTATSAITTGWHVVSISSVGNGS